MKTSIIDKNFLSLNHVIQAIPDLKLYCENTMYPFFSMPGFNNPSYKKLYNLFILLFKTCPPHYLIDQIKYCVSNLAEGTLNRIFNHCNLKKKDNASRNSYTPTDYEVQYSGMPDYLQAIFKNSLLKQQMVISLEKEVYFKMETIENLKNLLNLPEFNNYTRMKTYLESALIKDSFHFAYSILIFIVFSISHKDLTEEIVKDSFIDQLLIQKCEKNNNISNSINSSTESQVFSSKYNTPFVHEQYKNFAVYLYNDHGESTTDYCSGNIEFYNDSTVNLSFQDTPLNKTIRYTGKAYLFKENRLVYLILENKLTHRGAIVCFHFTEFKEDPKCYLRKGLFIATAEGDEHHRPFIKNIVFLHKESDQQDIIEGILKCCNMRESDEFIIIHDKKLNQFINKIYDLNFMDSLKTDRTNLENFLKKYKAEAKNEETYFLIQEDLFHAWLKKRYSEDIDEIQRKKLLFLLKSFSELPNAIYPYASKDTSYHIFQ